MQANKKLSDRKHTLLVHAIEEYIKDANPITSGSAKETIFKDISTATLRNELNTLEAMGYLKQVHTSGGRIPTAEGYKYYVSNLLKDIEIDEKALDSVREIISKRTDNLAEIVSKIAGVVSKATNYPTIIFVDRVDKLIIRGIKLVPLIDEQALFLIKTDSGYLNNTIHSPINGNVCEDASNYFSKIFTDKTIGYMIENMAEIEKNAMLEIEGFKEIVQGLINGMKQMVDKPIYDVKRENAVKMLSDKNVSTESQKILMFLEDEEELKKAMQTDEEEKDLVFVVPKEGEQMEGCALVKAPLVVAGETVASIGVIGPQRMNYSNIASALKLVMNELENVKKGDKNEGKE